MSRCTAAMRITEISFCDKIGYNIRSDETKKHILDTIENKYNIKIVARHFDKYDSERSGRILSSNPHMVSLRSNGNPYFLLLTRHNFNDIAVFIDKKVQQGYFLPRMIVSHLMLGNGGEDTILDGEMVKTKDGRWMYLINDALVLKGSHFQNTTLVKRLNALYDFLDKEYIPDEMSPFRIAIKKYFTYEEARANLDAHMASLAYTCRGVYFKPLYLRFRDILYNFDDTLVKKVKREKFGTGFMLGTGDAQLMPAVPKHQDPSSGEETASTLSECGEMRAYLTRKTAAPDVYELLDKGNQVVGTACVNSMKISRKMREMFTNKNLVDRVEVLYEFSERFNKWVPQFA